MDLVWHDGLELVAQELRRNHLAGIWIPRRLMHQADHDPHNKVLGRVRIPAAQPSAIAPRRPQQSGVFGRGDPHVGCAGKMRRVDSSACFTHFSHAGPPFSRTTKSSRGSTSR